LEWQLQDVFEIVGPHDLVVAVREPVSMQRHDSAGHDDEEAKPDPTADQQHKRRPVQLAVSALGGGQGVDDLAEQNRFDESRRGERHASQCQEPADSGLRPQQLEHANV
jgi:hypothetical protein